jgi:hypothetical protein
MLLPRHGANSDAPKPASALQLSEEATTSETACARLV